MPDRHIIDDFLAQHRIAVAGVSRNPHKFGNVLFRELKQRGYDVVPLNPTLKEFDGTPCFPSLTDVPKTVDGLLIVTPSSSAVRLIQDAIASGVRRVWLHKGAGGPGSVCSDAVQLCRENGIDVVDGACPLMFLKPSGFVHQVHRWWLQVTGALPH
jgi:uncharacterized protein